MKIYRFLTGMFLLVLAQSVCATNIAEVYQDAQDNDPVLGAAKAGLAATQQRIPQARSALLPDIRIGGTSAWNERSFPGGPTLNFFTGELGKTPDQNFNEHSWQAQLRQPLLDLEAWFTYRSSLAGVESAEWDFAATKQELIVRSVIAYLNVLRAEDLLDAAEAAEAAVKRQLEQVQQRFDVGLVAITDVLEARAGYDNAIVFRVQAAGDHGIFFVSLRTLTGQPYQSIARISESLPIVNPAPANEEEWVSTALATNLSIRTARAQLTAAQRTLRARRSGHLPTIDATVSTSHFVTGGTAFLGTKTDQDTYAVSISLPIYQGGLTSARAREARSLAEQSRQLLLDRQLNVTRDTRNLFRSVATDVVRVRARLKAIASSESALEATETGYEVGTRNIVDVLEAQNRLYSSQFDYADSRYNYIIDLMLLKQAAGTLAGADIRDLNSFVDRNNPVTPLNSLRVRGTN
ncbi:MAG: TolC family outer membrane protein [Pseudomonadales bacterium]